MTDIKELIKTAILLESEISMLKSRIQERNKELSEKKQSIYSYLCSGNDKKIAVTLNGNSCLLENSYLIEVSHNEIVISVLPTLTIDF